MNVEPHGLFKFTIFLIFRFSANETFIDIKSKNMEIKIFSL